MWLCDLAVLLNAAAKIPPEDRIGQESFKTPRQIAVELGFYCHLSDEEGVNASARGNGFRVVKMIQTLCLTSTGRLSISSRRGNNRRSQCKWRIRGLPRASGSIRRLDRQTQSGRGWAERFIGPEEEVCLCKVIDLTVSPDFELFCPVCGSLICGKAEKKGRAPCKHVLFLHIDLVGFAHAAPDCQQCVGGGRRGGTAPSSTC